MNIRIADYPTRFYVSSEEEPGVEFLVDLVAFPRDLRSPHGDLIYNGSCGRADMGVIGCKDFYYRCQRKLSMPENDKKILRCKHIRFARENCLDFLLPTMHQMDPNLPEEHQT